MEKAKKNKDELERLKTIIENNQVYIDQLRAENQYYKYALSRIQGTYAWKLYRIYKRFIKVPLVNRIFTYLQLFRKAKK